ncbi:MAG: 30S ribosomal protein S21 [Candidatus Gracilibacteria bacterium]|nr:30S ribosomal protein S21 [Candidatus Peregrinibacteria bacterium]
MSVHVTKNSKESVDRLISRFNKKVQGSRVLLEVKGRRYHKKAKTKRLVRQAAVMRDHYRDKRNKMQYY